MICVYDAHIKYVFLKPAHTYNLCAHKTVLFWNLESSEPNLSKHDSNERSRRKKMTNGDSSDDTEQES